MESGNPVFYSTLNGTQWYQPLYNYLTDATGCGNATDTLQCLRGLPYTQLNAVINATAKPLTNSWNPTVDGDFIQKFTSLQLAEGAFVRVPIISGANTDEGTAFSPQGINTTTDFYNALTRKSICLGSFEISRCPQANTLDPRFHPPPRRAQPLRHSAPSSLPRRPLGRHPRGAAADLPLRPASRRRVPLLRSLLRRRSLYRQ